MVRRNGTHRQVVPLGGTQDLAPAQGSVRAVDRVARVLLAFVDAGPHLGVTEIATRVQLPKSVVHRVLSSLTAYGLIARDAENGRYRLGSRAVQLGAAAIGGADIRALAIPTMERLSKLTSETVTLSLLVGHERVYAAQVEAKRLVRMTVELGSRQPLYAGASGRAILAWFSREDLDDYLNTTALKRLTVATVVDPHRLRRTLELVRRRRFAASQGERDAAAASVAAPLLDSSGRPLGSMSICGPISRFGRNDIVRYAAMLIKVTETISRGLR